ncbi:polyphosphate kinase 1 [Fulvimonas soli]|jgi:polyphosphate kinase|uniref:Polyphosphate kinase n=1 Tax=Fulvimonas soli TaxID=155197 RepID=A0A316IQD2_9GAMM|nr:polyphosphate kinase 1 [Fulvimonas soli]PWK92778.1 polyphosphate kinase [Fulvimonas soli]TNY28054.1 polyphosphate kinase 1 [Fulvimonas soli]
MTRKPPPTAALATPDLAAPELYLSRELAALEFNFRVLAMAHDPAVPLLERLRYLSIVANNLDEFFEVRVAMLKHHHMYGSAAPGPDGIPSGELLARIRARVLDLVGEQYATWRGELGPQLEAEGIRFLTRDRWSERQRRWLQGYFEHEVLPVLSPLGLDPAHPFPRILNKTLNIAVVLKGRDAFGHEGHMALVRAPRSLPRIIRIPPEVDGGGDDFVFLAELLQAFVDLMFPGFKVVGSYQFRVTRNSELMVEEAEVENLARALSEELAGRGYARPVRLEIADDCPKAITRMLVNNFELEEADVYRCDGPVNIIRAGLVYDWVDRPDLKFPRFTPRQPPAIGPGRCMFEAIGQRDVLLHHPYESFGAVVELLRQASADPDVLAIKQTLYRAGEDTPLVDLLVEAARNGKDVTVVIELRARFDEEANIRLATRLQEVGVQVVYGVVGYKTHAKMMLIVRREGGALRRYAHLSTGNYHQANSRVYTDIGLMTAQPEITEDLHKVFQQLSGLGPVIHLRRLLQSPFTLYKSVMAKIERETAHAQAGKPARIVAKLNALNEAHVIQALYRASQAGVEIDLIVRGACTLRPGLPGVSERIRVRSIVGRFLEHSRVYWFYNDGDSELYCGSADWMERNLMRRIEVAFPILDPALAARVFEETLANGLADNTQAWLLGGDGRYVRATPGEQPPHNAQQTLLERLCGA